MLGSDDDDDDDDDGESDGAMDVDDTQATSAGGGAGAKARFDWPKASQALMTRSRRVLVPDLMYGPLEIELKVRKQAQRKKKARADESERNNPVDISQDDILKDEQETERMIRVVKKCLMGAADENGGALPLLEFVVNPNSFSQTVENLYYFAFLVKAGEASIEKDNGDYVCCAFLLFLVLLWLSPADASAHAHASRSSPLQPARRDGQG